MKRTMTPAEEAAWLATAAGGDVTVHAPTTVLVPAGAEQGRSAPQKERLLAGCTPASGAGDTVIQPTIDAQACTHWWVVASPNGPTSKARCKKCKARRSFPNSSYDDSNARQRLKATQSRRDFRLAPSGLGLPR